MSYHVAEHVNENEVRYRIRPAAVRDLPYVRSVMLDTVYRDFGHGYLPKWHGDIIDLDGFYLEPEDHALFVAEAVRTTINDDKSTEVTTEIVGTAGVRRATPASPPHPDIVNASFDDDKTATLYRVYVRPEFRRNGVAGALVTACLDFVASAETYTGVYLHTDDRVPGAVAFWNRYGTIICDERSSELSADDFQTVHFRLDF